MRDNKKVECGEGNSKGRERYVDEGFASTILDFTVQPFELDWPLVLFGILVTVLIQIAYDLLVPVFSQQKR